MYTSYIHTYIHAAYMDVYKTYFSIIIFKTGKKPWYKKVVFKFVSPAEESPSTPYLPEYNVFR